MSKEKEKEFYQLEGALEDSCVVKNNITYFINGFTDEFIKKIKTIYVSVSNSGTFAIYGKAKGKKRIGVPYTDKLKKIVFDSENNSISIDGMTKDLKSYTESETYDVEDFKQLSENIPILLKEQGVHKFKKRKYGNKITLNFEIL